MKKRIISMLLVLAMAVSMVSVLDATTFAASTLTISSPEDDEWVSKSDPPKLRWNKVTGAAGYRVTIVDTTNGKDLVRNEWTTSRSFSMDDVIASASGYPLLKIWVGAMASKNDDASQTSLSSDIIWITVAETPDVTNNGASSITSNGATLKLTVTKNYGSAIEDAGFYIGTSSSISSATRYSVSKTVNNGAMSLNVSGLAANTKYYYWAYAENGVGETTSGYSTFTTAKAASSAKFDHAPTLDLSIAGNYLGNDVYGTYVPGDEIYFRFTADYSDHVYVQTSSSQLVFQLPSGVQNNAGTFVEKSSSSTFSPKSYTNGSEFELYIKIPEGIPAGDYTISVTATDGVFDPVTENSIAGTSHYSSVKESLTVRIGSKPSGGGSGGEYSLEVPSTLDEAKAMVIFSTDNTPKAVSVGKIRHIPQVKKHDPYFCDEYWIGYDENNVKYDTVGGAGGYCTRAVYSMVLSYFGIDCTPGRMAALMKTTGSISGNSYDQVTTKLQLDYSGLSLAKKGKLSTFFENYANDGTYSPVYVYFGPHEYYNSEGTLQQSDGHAILVIGRDSENPNKYYCVEPDCGTGGNVTTMVVNSSENKTIEYTWGSCRGRTILYCYQWQYTGSSIVPEAKTYTITYDGNDWEDGNCEPITVEKKHGEDLIIADVYTTNGNREFLGWAVYPNLNTPVYQPDDRYTENKSECFYAVWGESKVEETPTHIRGDANGDGVKNTSDFTYVLIHIVTKGLVNKNIAESLDYNGDGNVTVSDATYLLINIVTKGLVNKNLH